MCAISEERDSFFEDRTDAQHCCRFDNKCLVFGESMPDPIISEHYPYPAYSRTTEPFFCPARTKGPQTVVVLLVVAAAGEGDALRFAPCFGGVVDKFAAVIVGSFAATGTPKPEGVRRP